MSFYILEYVNVLKRRKTLFLVVAGLVFVASLIFALRWSNYRAFATVEVTRPEISMDVIDTGDRNSMSVEAMADMQISRLKQKVLSTAYLSEIITKLNLYPEERKYTPIAYIAEDMRKNINVRLVSTSLANQASAQKASAMQLSAIAFVLSFEYRDAQLTQKAVNELVSRFLDEDIKERLDMAKKTTEFLDGQINILSEKLEEQEQEIAVFRTSNGDIRPDSLVFNQQAAATTTTRLLSLESELVSNLGVIGALRSQLAQTDAYARVVDEGGAVLSTPAIQLRALKSQYASLTAKYGSSHPDVVKISRQINGLESSINPRGFRSRLKVKIADAKVQLSTAEKSYGLEHPDVLALHKKVASLEEQLKAAQDDEKGASIVHDADNPAYLQIVAQLEATQEQQKALEQQRDEVKKQEDQYRQAIAANPAVEQKMALLVRDYDNLMSLYRDLKAKKLAAEMNETIEQGRIGQRLSVIEAPQVPLGTNPSRLLLVVIGLFLGTGAGLGIVIAMQILGQKVMGCHHLEGLIGVAPLVTIPHLKTLDEKISEHTLAINILMFAPIFLILLAGIFFLMIMPFDVFLAVVSRKLGL